MQSRFSTALGRRLDLAAPSFDEHAFVHRETCAGLLHRLEPVTLRAREVVDLGAATGAAVRPLRKRFRGARVHAVDISMAMLRQHRGSWLARASRIQASADALPFADASIDVVFANLLLPFVEDLDGVLAEISRVLRSDGLFAFATLGPDSFSELRQAWSDVDDEIHVARFTDMHDIGDAIVRAGLRDPVLDVDRLAVSYRDTRTLFADLAGTGARNSLAGRRATLTGRGRLAAFERRLGAGGLPLKLQLELVYGHAFGGTPRAAGRTVAIDPTSIRRRG